MKKEELTNELERMSKDSEGMLTMCAFPDCRKIEVTSGEEKYWLLRKEEPELYDNVLSNHENRNSLDDLCISHSFCPTCYEREMKKLGSGD